MSVLKSSFWVYRMHLVSLGKGEKLSVSYFKKIDGDFHVNSRNTDERWNLDVLLPISIVIFCWNNCFYFRLKCVWIFCTNWFISLSLSMHSYLSPPWHCMSSNINGRNFQQNSTCSLHPVILFSLHFRKIFNLFFFNNEYDCTEKNPFCIF